jgi:hypothetical protein
MSILTAFLSDLNRRQIQTLRAEPPFDALD